MMLPHLNAILTCCHSLAERICNPYRPERHYMRGPGPKWHAMHRAAPDAGRP